MKNKANTKPTPWHHTRRIRFDTFTQFCKEWRDKTVDTPHGPLWPPILSWCDLAKFVLQGRQIKKGETPGSRGKSTFVRGVKLKERVPNAAYYTMFDMRHATPGRFDYIITLETGLGEPTYYLFLDIPEGLKFFFRSSKKQHVRAANFRNTPVYVLGEYSRYRPSLPKPLHGVLVDEHYTPGVSGYTMEWFEREGNQVANMRRKVKLKDTSNYDPAINLKGFLGKLWELEDTKRVKKGIFELEEIKRVQKGEIKCHAITP